MNDFAHKPPLEQGEVLPIGQEVIYFSAPKNYQHTEAYAAILSQIKRRHPHDLILEPAVLWQEHDWLSTHPTILRHVTRYYLATRIDGTIGRGAYTEYLYFRARGVPMLAITPEGLLPVQSVEVLEDGENWIMFAFVFTGSPAGTGVAGAK